jgi:hypothetical protein
VDWERAGGLLGVDGGGVRAARMAGRHSPRCRIAAGLGVVPTAAEGEGGLPWRTIVLPYFPTVAADHRSPQ